MKLLKCNNYLSIMETKKIYSLFILWGIAVSSMFSQSVGYTPFPEHYGRWILNRDHPVGDGSTGKERWNLTQYETAGDTTINGVKYKKVIASQELKDIVPGPKNVWTHDYGPKQLAFAYRNDIPNKKVYILTDAGKIINGNLKQEYVWYNFDVKLGDTLESSYAINWTANQVDYKRITVSYTDSAFNCGTYSRRFYFKCGGGFNDWLAEGIGFESNFIQTYVYCEFEPTTLYKTYFSCSPTSIPQADQQPLSIAVYPNPANEAIQLDYSDPTHELKGWYALTDYMGRVVTEGICSNSPIEILKLSSGIYTITLLTNDGNFYKVKFIKQ